VEKVPLAAKVLDVRESQKLRIIDRLKLERQRVRFEAEIGKAPPLSDDELAEHIREEAYVTTSFMFASVNSEDYFLLMFHPATSLVEHIHASSWYGLSPPFRITVTLLSIT
jgi:hypothetical protein